MSILSELNTLISPLLSVETGVFSGVPPNEYVVLTPLSDTFAVYRDNRPLADIHEVRVSLFSKNNYLQRKNQLVRMLLQADFVITDRRYIGHEDDTGYHHYAIDVAKYYELEE
jgi:hypothetical protein